MLRSSSGSIINDTNDASATSGNEGSDSISEVSSESDPFDDLNENSNSSMTPIDNFTIHRFEDLERLFLTRLSNFNTGLLNNFRNDEKKWKIIFCKPAELDDLPSPMDTLASTSYLEQSHSCYDVDAEQMFNRNV